MRIYDEEDQNIEFKESWNSTELLKWVCGFEQYRAPEMGLRFCKCQRRQDVYRCQR